MRKICVIGAGVSGLPAIKACLEEGMDVICFEKTSEIGGLWNYRPDKDVGGGSVMFSTVVNTSKEMMAYSDFPPPAEFPNFMHNSLVQKYLELYAQEFSLLPYIRFNTEVSKVSKSETGDQWEVISGTLTDGKLHLSIEFFDGIMLCTGHHTDKVTPHLKGLETFQGMKMHAKEYRDYRGFEGKNVFLIGIGNSALDIAVELARISKRVILSTRRGSWIFNRVGQNGVPYDIVLHTRFYQWLIKVMPWTITNEFMEYRVHGRMDHELYGLKPAHRFFQQHPAVNDALANLVASGMITITGDVKKIRERSVVVEDGREFQTDVLLLCTGYSFAFPFLDPPSLIPIIDQKVDLYKFVFPPNLPNVAIIGLIQPIGSVAPISEMQARWAAGVFSGRVKLPSEGLMREDIAKTMCKMHRQYFKSEKHTIQVNFLPYMDEMASFAGCKPTLKKFFFEDPSFAIRLYFGPNLPYVYRLEGENAWSGAKKAILGVSERVKFPLKSRCCSSSETPPQRRTKKGYLANYFRYEATKCYLMYFFVILSAGIWLFCGTEFGAISYSLFILSLLAVTSFVYIFHVDIVWI